jgi:hypothetical protein
MPHRESQHLLLRQEAESEARAMATPPVSTITDPHPYVIQPTTPAPYNLYIRRHCLYHPLSNLLYNKSLLAPNCIGQHATNLEIVVRAETIFNILRRLTKRILAAPYPIYSHSTSYTSVHSASSSSMHPAPSVSGHQRPPMASRTSSNTSVTTLSHNRPPMPPRTSSGTSIAPSLLGHHHPLMPPRTSSATSVATSEPKPALKQTKPWIGNSNHSPRTYDYPYISP